MDDVVSIAGKLIANPLARNISFNIANVTNYPMLEIVRAIEQAVGKPAVYDMVERGSEYHIDVSAILPVMTQAGVNFGDDYLKRVINKYYGNASGLPHAGKVNSGHE